MSHFILTAYSSFSPSSSYGTATNNRMLHVLSDLVKTFLDTENDIQKQLEALGLENGSTRAEDSGLIGFTSLDDERISDLTFDGLCDDGPDLTTPSSMIYSTNHSLNNGNNTTNDIEDDVVLGASRRLRLGVERVLKILNEVVSHHSQTDIKGLLKEKEDLANELQEEVQRRDQLTRQLLDKESALHRMEGEKRALVERTTDYGEVKAERDQLKLKLEEYERDRKKFINDHKRFEAEKNSFNQGLPQLQQSKCRISLSSLFSFFPFAPFCTLGYISFVFAFFLFFGCGSFTHSLTFNLLTISCTFTKMFLFSLNEGTG